MPTGRTSGESGKESDVKMGQECSKEEFEAALAKVLYNARKFDRAVQVRAKNEGGSVMKSVIVYLWVDVWEMDYCLDPEFWDREPEYPPLHVSLKDPTEDESALMEDDKLGEGRGFLLLKRKIYLLPPFLNLADSEHGGYDAYFESEGCHLKWDPQKNTVVAKSQYGAYPLIPAD